MGWLPRPLREIRLSLIRRAFLKALKNEAAEEFLKLLLNLMTISFLVDSAMRSHIEGFIGRIQFRSRDNQIRVLAEFKDDRLKTRDLEPNEKISSEPNATIVFKDAEALMNFLLPRGGQRDILRSLLRNEVTLDGNFNYIYRFGFLANHLQLQVTNMLK